MIYFSIFQNYVSSLLIMKRKLFGMGIGKDDSTDKPADRLFYVNIAKYADPIMDALNSNN